MAASSPTPLDATGERLYGDVIRTLAQALDLDEGVKLYHGWRVGLLAHGIGAHLPGPGGVDLYTAGLLHDIGGIGLADHIVHHARNPEPSPGAVTHVREGARILRPFELFRPLVEVVADHHERYDGRGYPRGRAGAAIPVAAGIVHLADTLEVGLRFAGAGERLALAREVSRSSRGTLCAPEVADAALALLEADADLAEALYDDAALRRRVQAVRPDASGLGHVSVVELLSQLLWLFSRLIDAKHAYTVGHSQRVAFYALRIASALGPDQFNPWDLLWAGLLHDVGKVGVPRRLLEKPGALAADERAQVEKHAQDTIDLISSISDLEPLAYPAAAHHERYDGSGYPRGTAGEAIPLLGRILCLADAYDAMTSDRAYRRGLPHEEAVSRLRQGAGQQFDPALVEIAVEALAGVGTLVGPLPTDLAGFHEFFGTSGFDARKVLSRTSAQAQLVKPVGRGVLLLDLEPWSLLTLGPGLDVLEGGESLARFLGGPAPGRLGDALDPESEAQLEDMVGVAGPGVPVTRYLFTSRGRPLEAVLTRAGEGFSLHYRTAENRLQSLSRLALFYRSFLSSVEAVCFVDPTGRVLDVNRRYLDLSRSALRDVAGQSWHRLFAGGRTPWDADGGVETESWAGECALAGADGTLVPVELTLTAIRDVRGQHVGHIVRALDIRDRLREERRVRALGRCVVGFGADHAANIRQLVTVLGEALEADQVRYCRRSEAGVRVFAELHPGADPVTCGDAHRCPRDLPVDASPERLRALPCSGGRPVIGRLIRPGVGAPVGLLTVAFPAGAEGTDRDEGWLEAFAAALAHEEERLAARSALEASEGRYRALSEALEVKNQALEQLSDLKSEMLAVTSHDLKSPVHAMLSYVNLLRDRLGEADEATQRRYLDRISATGDKLLRFIRDLLDAERIGAGLLRIQPVPTELSDLLREGVEAVSPTAEERGIRVALEVLGQCPRLRLDPARLEQVVSNLLSNALRFTREGGTVTVRLDARAPEVVTVTVEDEGPGVPPGERQSIFDRFVQGRTASAAPGRGSGLGLAIAKGITELHGGRIWVGDGAGGGAAFHVELPVVALRAREPLAVLLVDPQGDLRAQLEAPVSGRGAELTVVDGTGAARERLAREPVDVIVVAAGTVDAALREAVAAARSGRLALAVEVATEPGDPAPPFTLRLAPPLLPDEVHGLLHEATLIVRARKGDACVDSGS
jgi:PAS domain S-box-containing protein